MIFVPSFAFWNFWSLEIEMLFSCYFIPLWTGNFLIIMATVLSLPRNVHVFCVFYLFFAISLQYLYIYKHTSILLLLMIAVVSWMSIVVGSSQLCHCCYTLAAAVTGVSDK